MEIKEIKVGIADLNLTTCPGRIITVGLGSCIGIAIYDTNLKLGGLAHIMLPDSTQFSNAANPYKFADLAVPILIEKLEKMGAKRINMKSKIAGGASMFNFSDKKMIMDIGNRNSAAVKQALGKEKIKIVAEDTGGNRGRTMVLDVETGVVTIRTVGMAVKEI